MSELFGGCRFAGEQEIVCWVEGLFALTDQIEARSHAAQMQVSRLTPSLIAKAFRGQLATQASEESAKKLLERIRPWGRP